MSSFNIDFAVSALDKASYPISSPAAFLIRFTVLEELINHAYDSNYICRLSSGTWILSSHLEAIFLGNCLRSKASPIELDHRDLALPTAKESSETWSPAGTKGRGRDLGKQKQSGERSSHSEHGEPNIYRHLANNTYITQNFKTKRLYRENFSRKGFDDIDL